MDVRQKAYKRMQQLIKLDQDELVNLVLSLENQVDLKNRYIAKCEARILSARLFSSQQPKSLLEKAPNPPTTQYRQLGQDNK